MTDSESGRKPGLAATSYALLGLLSYEQELSGYDIRKWIGWTMRFYYGSPAYSQIYSELKKLEHLGLLT
ncbi:MAG: PadR family transcriptional regulator, partial [Dietzia sp.]|nr:PadR family transcriptional regulator [Dietzia sp.]